MYNQLQGNTEERRVTPSHVQTTLGSGFTATSTVEGTAIRGSAPAEASRPGGMSGSGVAVKKLTVGLWFS